MDLFVCRKDAWAVGSRGRYRAVRGSLSLEQIEAHLRGEVSLQVYALSPAGQGRAVARWGAFDLDAHGGDPSLLAPLACDLRTALSALVGQERVVVERTGGEGLHVWALLGCAHPADRVVAVMDEALRTVGLPSAARNDLGDGRAVERYPKRAHLTGKTGSALRLPLGRHSRTDNWSELLDPSTGAARDPVNCLFRFKPFGEAEMAAIVGRIAPPRRHEPRRRGGVACPDVWETYLWAVRELGLEGRTEQPGAGDAFPVRCLFPDAHRHEDRSGMGSAYLVRRGVRQLYGCNVCEGGRAYDSIGLIRRVRPGASFEEARALARAIDPKISS